MTTCSSCLSKRKMCKEPQEHLGFIIVLLCILIELYSCFELNFNCSLAHDIPFLDRKSVALPYCSDLMHVSLFSF